MPECISAVSTANGAGGVAIIRISGDGARDIARKMFKPSAKPSGGAVKFSPNRMYFGRISGCGFYDYGYMVYFAAPRSFTGEDVVEFHCHGGVQISRGILKKTFELGARAAERGEFTRRAFLNGKLSLASAEGMIDMINAESLAMLRAGGMLYSEKLSREAAKIQDALKETLAAIDAELDYPEEDLDGLDLVKIKNGLKALNGKIDLLVKSYASGKKIKNGISVAICGKPNVGKSSLLNAVLGYDKAIVSAEEGTTRDAVEGTVEIDGINYNFIDTAGIREQAGEVEKIGIERAKKAIRGADIVLFVTDGEGRFTEEYSGSLVTVFNKCDAAVPSGEYDVAVSAVTGEGIDALKKLISGKISSEYVFDGAYVIERRHYDALVRARDALAEAAGNSGATPDLIAVDLKEAWSALGEITGETASEEIIDEIFSKFCVGK